MTNTVVSLDVFGDVESQKTTWIIGQSDERLIPRHQKKFIPTEIQARPRRLGFQVGQCLSKGYAESCLTTRADVGFERPGPEGSSRVEMRRGMKDGED